MNMFTVLLSTEFCQRVKAMFAKGICAETQKFEKVDDIRHTPKYKALYERRKRDN